MLRYVPREFLLAFFSDFMLTGCYTLMTRRARTVVFLQFLCAFALSHILACVCLECPAGGPKRTCYVLSYVYVVP